MRDDAAFGCVPPHWRRFRYSAIALIAVLIFEAIRPRDAVRDLARFNLARISSFGRGDCSQACQMAYKILVLKGDGIGPEVVGEALQVLKIVARATRRSISSSRKGLIGGHAIDAIRHSAARRRAQASRRTATRSCSARSAARSGTTPRPTMRPEQALLGLAQGTGTVRQHAAGQDGQGTDGRRRRCSPRSSAASISWSFAS